MFSLNLGKERVMGGLVGFFFYFFCFVLGWFFYGVFVYFRCFSVLMLKFSVGEMVSMFFLLNFFSMVVFLVLFSLLGRSSLSSSFCFLLGGDIVVEFFSGFIIFYYVLNWVEYMFDYNRFMMNMKVLNYKYYFYWLKVF